MNFLYWNVRSFFFREGNCCADKLVNLGHSVNGSVGCLLSLMSGMLISLGIVVVYPTTDFHSLILGYFSVVFFIFLLFVFSSRVFA